MLKRSLSLLSAISSIIIYILQNKFQLQKKIKNKKITGLKLTFNSPRHALHQVLCMSRNIGLLLRRAVTNASA